MSTTHQPPLRVGIIGCGNISAEYMLNLPSFAPLVQVTACADQIDSRAQDFGARHNIQACPRSALLHSDSVDIILNLTPPAAHVEVSQAALQAGKHVYSEKPLALTFDQGKLLLETARQKGVQLACAPDTFLGGGLQTCRKLVADGWIGEAVAASAFMTCHGHEDWHPAPEFYYRKGGGPLFDMGPYYLTALVTLLGPLRRVCAYARSSFSERIVTSPPGPARRIPVETPTHYTASLEFRTGPLATLMVSFDIWQASLPHLEIYGSAGTLCCPDPNTFGGPVRLFSITHGGSAEIPLSHTAQIGRGIGVADLAASLIEGRPPRASGEMALHVLEAMCAIERAASLHESVELSTSFNPPAPLMPGRVPMAGQADRLVASEQVHWSLAGPYPCDER